MDVKVAVFAAIVAAVGLGLILPGPATPKAEPVSQLTLISLN